MQKTIPSPYYNHFLRNTVPELRGIFYALRNKYGDDILHDLIEIDERVKRRDLDLDMQRNPGIRPRTGVMRVMMEPHGKDEDAPILIRSLFSTEEEEDDEYYEPSQSPEHDDDDVPEEADYTVLVSIFAFGLVMAFLMEHAGTTWKLIGSGGTYAVKFITFLF